MSLERVYQINLQKHFGGGEVYTAFLTRALAQAGVKTTLATSPHTGFWDRLLGPDDCERIAVAGDASLLQGLPARSVLVLTHGGLEPEIAQALAARHRLVGIAHMPLYGRRADAFRHHRLVIPVSDYVRGSLEAALPREKVYPVPLYGIAAVSRRASAESALIRRSEYDWDLRKGRDRILARLYPLWQRLRPVQNYERRPGLTLGIVSRLTPIKQFPVLLSLLAPHIARQEGVTLDIFGAGGYASVRDLRRALRPLGARARFWGYQQDVGSVYAQLDYLLAGLPEKEALGLNVIEAQSCNLPVLAVRAAPFTETLIDAKGGFFYADPRQDQGADFAQLLHRLAAADAPRLAPAQEQTHLARFSEAAFTARVSALADVLAQLPAP
ncbi:MAG: glycosyltransferase family 4 protein [Betaproteobacteria bacterium]|nr:glycosyltransferase family 4 protein [Betaproteobacteria bacterium]